MEHNEFFERSINLETEYEQLDISNFFVFGKVMENPELCKEMLERLTGEQIYDISEISVEKTLKVASDSRGIRYDVLLDDSSHMYDAEMENRKSKKKELPKRGRFYQSMLDLKDLEQGCRFTELKDNYVIFICTFDPFDKGHAFYGFSNQSNDDEHFELSDGRTIIYFNTKGNMDCVTPEAASFLRYVETGIVQDDYTGKLQLAVDNVRQDRKVRCEYMFLEQRILEETMNAYDNGFDNGFDNGYDNGYDNGHKKAIIELYQKKIITLETALSELGMTSEELEKEISGEVNGGKDNMISFV